MAALQQQKQQLGQQVEQLQLKLAQVQEEHRSLKATSEAMLEAKDSELLAALRKTALLTEELGQLRQQQQQQHMRQQSLSAAASQQQQAQGRISSSSAMDGGAEVFGVVAGGDDGSSAPSRHDGSGPMTAAAYCSQQLLTGYTASEPGNGVLAAVCMQVHSRQCCISHLIACISSDMRCCLIFRTRMLCWSICPRLLIDLWSCLRHLSFARWSCT
jgi:hypothetical protein